jgi:predicted hydrolase (HD superfamily)
LLSVEAADGFYANKLNQPEELWAVTGILHDFDWEIHPSMKDIRGTGRPILP